MRGASLSSPALPIQRKSIHSLSTAICFLPLALSFLPLALSLASCAGNTSSPPPTNRMLKAEETMIKLKTNQTRELGFALSSGGVLIGGQKVNRQTITREEALIAHTRNNAYIVFQDGNLGMLTPGRYADLVVLDRDYFKVPADEIKDIKPVMTMVGGKIVFESTRR